MKSYLLTLVGLSLLVGAKSPNDETKKDLAALQGQWVVIYGECDGEIRKEAIENGLLWEFKDNTVSFYLDDNLKPVWVPFKLNPATKPKQIDLLADDGKQRDLAIYELQGDYLKLCWGGDKRPARFCGTDESEPGAFYALRRSKNPMPHPKPKKCAPKDP